MRPFLLLALLSVTLFLAFASARVLVHERAGWRLQASRPAPTEKRLVRLALTQQRLDLLEARPLHSNLTINYLYHSLLLPRGVGR